MDNSGTSTTQDLTATTPTGVSFQPPAIPEPTPNPIAQVTQPNWPAQASAQTPQPTTIVNVTAAPPLPWAATSTVPTPPPVAVPTAVTSETTTVVEPSMPARKKGVSPVLLSLVALVLVGGVAGATFMVSRRINQQSAVAPNAPESEPQAFEPTPTEVVTPAITGGFNPNGEIDCSEFPNTAPYGNRCLPTVTDQYGNVTWSPDAKIE